MTLNPDNMRNYKEKEKERGAGRERRHQLIAKQRIKNKREGKTKRKGGKDRVEMKKRERSRKKIEREEKEEGLIQDPPKIGNDSYKLSVTLNLKAFLHVICNPHLKNNFKYKMLT